MKEYYQKNHQKYYNQTFSINPTSFLSPLARRLHPGSTILDVGCGSGRDMRWLKDQGFQPEGFERSQGLAGLARAHSGCPVLEGDFEVHDFSGMKMDAILLVGALVNVPHEQLSGVLSNIVRALKPEGFTLITMKEGQKISEDAGDRVFYLWGDEALRAVFEPVNLTVVHFSRQVSKIRESDVWVGYVLKMHSKEVMP